MAGVSDLVNHIPAFRESLHGSDMSKEHQSLLRRVHDFVKANIYRGYPLTDISKGTELVLEGGGVKGIIYVGMIRALSEITSTAPGKEGQSVLQAIDHVIGTSAGSITAGLVALGASPDQTSQIMNELDFNTFKDRSWWWFTSIYNLLFGNKGIYNGDKLESTLGDIYNTVLRSHLEPDSKVHEGAQALIRTFLESNKGHDVTLGLIKQLHSIDPVHFKLPIMKAYCRDDKKIVNFDAEQDKDADVKLKFAAAASSSIPYYFCYKVDADGHSLVDGGLVENDGDREAYRFVGPRHERDFSRIINARVESTAEMQELVHEWLETVESEMLAYPKEEDSDFLKFSKDILGAALNGQFFEFMQSDLRKQYSIIFESGDVSATEFDLSADQKRALEAEGYDETHRRHQYGQKAQTLPFHAHEPMDVDSYQPPMMDFQKVVSEQLAAAKVKEKAANDALLEFMKATP